jgi:hypothetical protein
MSGGKLGVFAPEKTISNGALRPGCPMVGSGRAGARTLPVTGNVLRLVGFALPRDLNPTPRGTFNIIKYFCFIVW